MATRKANGIASTDYTRVMQATNMDVVTDLADSSPNHYASLLLGQRNMMELPIKNVVKIYLDAKKE